MISASPRYCNGDWPRNDAFVWSVTNIRRRPKVRNRHTVGMLPMPGAATRRVVRRLAGAEQGTHLAIADACRSAHVARHAPNWPTQAQRTRPPRLDRMRARLQRNPSIMVQPVRSRFCGQPVGRLLIEGRTLTNKTTCFLSSFTNCEAVLPRKGDPF